MKLILTLSMAALLLGCGNLVKSGAIVEAQNAIDKNNYAEALENTEIAESFGETSAEDTAKIHYLRALSLQGLGRQQEALTSFRYVVEQHRSSAYAAPSRQKLEAAGGLSTLNSD